MNSRSREITFRGRRYPVIDSLRVRRRNYLVLRRLATAHNERILVFDPGAGGSLRTILQMPIDPATFQRIHVLKRLNKIDDLPQILDIEKKAKNTFIVLTWIEGIDLAEYFRRVRKGKVDAPEPFEAIRLIRGLAHGLRTLHEHAQIIHGDLKPRNLIITRKPCRLQMIDFGSAWPTERTSRRFEGDGISPTYSAPELQEDLQSPLCHVDQFSVSVILYQLLTQCIPYSELGGKAGRQDLQAEMENTLIPPSRACRFAGRLPRHLWQRIDQLVIRGLTLDPQKRFPTTNAWLTEIEEIFLPLRLTRVNGNKAQTVFGSYVDWFRTKFAIRNS